MKILKNIIVKLGSLDRRVIFLLIAVSVIVPILKPEWINLPIRPQSHSQIVFNEINNLERDNRVLLSFDYGPSTMPEIHPMAIALLRHMFAKNLKIYGFALWADGNFMSTKAFSKVVDQYNKIYDKDYINLGFKPGGEPVIKGIASNIREMYTSDMEGTHIDSLEMMKNVHNIKDFDLVISLSAGDPGSKQWVQFATDPENIRFTTGCTSIQVTDIVPYVENEQIKGILAGMPGAAEYENLIEKELKKLGAFWEPGRASSMMSAQSLAHVVIVLFIIFGNVSYYIARKKTRKG